jgi:hypothetical protein
MQQKQHTYHSCRKWIYKSLIKLFCNLAFEFIHIEH